MFHVDKLVTKKQRQDRFKDYLRQLVRRLETDEAKELFDNEQVMSRVALLCDKVPQVPVFSEE